MNDAGPPVGREPAISVSCATPVTSLLAIFLGWLDRPFGTDTLDPEQGVELKWRELNGMTQPDELATHLKANLPSVRERIVTSDRPGSAAAAAAIDVISILLDDSIDEVERCSRIAGQALRVALEMDRASAVVPRNQRSWAAFELRAQADLFDQVAGAGEGFSAEFIDDLREEAGAQSMAYRNGMKALGTG